MNRIILVVAAHPDDEVIGCGGTMARHAADDDEVHVAFLADGVSSRDGASEAEAAERRRQSLSAAKVLGAHQPVHLGFPDNRLDHVDLLDVVKPIERLVAEVQPSVVYTHHAADLNIDHAICHRAVLTALRPMAGTVTRAIYAFEVSSSTEWAFSPAALAFAPNRFVDIDRQLESKRSALRAYEKELREFPHPRSIEAIDALARWRGATVGSKAAEAFMVVRELV